MLPAVGLLAEAHGATGAAIGTVIGEAALALGYMVALRRGEPAVAPSLAASVPAAAAALPPLGLLWSGLPSGLAAVLALILYGVLLLVFRAIPDELIDLVPRRSRWRR